jgi:hypothetical protein
LTLRPLSERASTTLVLQVLAEVDARPPVGKSLRLVDSESDMIREIHVDAIAARRYRDALARHQENWHAACRQVGALFATVIAEEVLRDWNLDVLVAAGLLKIV